MKKNIIIIILSLLLVALSTYIIYDKTNDNKGNEIVNKTSSDNEDKLNPNTETNQKTEITHSQEEIKEKTEVSTEEDIVNYFENLDTELTNYTNNESLSKSIKSKFVKCIDFLFYGGKIGNKTFKELTNSTKLKILEITMSIDSKIDNKFPGYKESISNTYQDIKTKIVEKYLETTTNICNNDQKLCNTAKEGFKNLKDNFGITWNQIKSLASSGTDKLKDWYEIWRYN